MLLGIAFGVVAIVGLMMTLGHWDVFKQNIADLLGVATGSSGAASHNAGGMVMEMLAFYGQCLLVGAKMFPLWALVGLSGDMSTMDVLRYCGFGFSWRCASLLHVASVSHHAPVVGHVCRGDYIHYFKTRWRSCYCRMAGSVHAAGVPPGQRWRDQQWWHHRMDGGSRGCTPVVQAPRPSVPASSTRRCPS